MNKIISGIEQNYNHIHADALLSDEEWLEQHNARIKRAPFLAQPEDEIITENFAKAYGGQNFNHMLQTFHRANIEDQDENQRTYIASKHATPFHLDTTSSIKGLKAGVGTGKTSAICVELQRLATLQYPDKNGVRWFKVLAVRGTHNELRTTTLQTWMHWAPQSLCKITVSPYIKGHIRMPLPDGTILDFTIEFESLPDLAACSKLRGREFTVAWMNELPEIRQPIEVMQEVETRLYRFPSIDVAPIRWSGVLVDFNPSNIGGKVYKFFNRAQVKDMEAGDDEDQKSGVKLYEYPSALNRIPNKTDPDSYIKSKWVPNPDADFHKFNNKGYQYWKNMTDRYAHDEDYIRKNVEGKWTLGSGSKPCHKNFSRRDHVGDTLLDKDAPVIIGADGGLKPAIIFAQVILGTLHVQHELIVDDVVTEELLDDYVLPRLAMYYSWARRKVVFHDPGNNNRSANQQDSRFTPLAAWRMRGFEVGHIPVPANKTRIRHDAVNSFLNRRGGVIINPRCEYLVQAMSGQYQWAKPKGDYEEASTDLLSPLKNRYADIADAFQYLCFGTRGGTIGAGSGSSDTDKQAELWGEAPTLADSGFLWV